MIERFSRDHRWIRVDGNGGTVGITDYAQSQLGDVTSVELPEARRHLCHAHVELQGLQCGRK